MVWHIFKKDLKLLWPLVATVATVHLLNAVLQLKLAHFNEPLELANMARMLSYAVFLGIAALIVTAVHEDPVPGDRQDWLVRPIRRADLLLAKILFVLIAVHGPMLLADLGRGLALGFGFADSLSAALSRALLLLLAISLPVLALAAMTRTAVQLIGGALALFLICNALILLTQYLGLWGRSEPLSAGAISNGIVWMASTSWFAGALAAAAVIIPLQYFRRATIPARGIALGMTVLAQTVLIVPWAWGFSLQQRLSPDPALADAVAVTFEPDLGRLASEPNVPRLDPRLRKTVIERPANSAWLPLRVSGLAPDSFVISDSALIRIVSRDGEVLFRGRTTGDPQTTGVPFFGPTYVDDFSIRTTTGGDVSTHELITLPAKIYEIARNQPLRVELDYAFTLYRVEASSALPALDGDTSIANFGWCKTRIDDDADEVELACLNPGRAPNCGTIVLENARDGLQNPPFNPCRRDYAPYDVLLFLDPIFRFGGGIPFRDPQGLAKFPVDGSQLADAQVLLKSYRPVAHFTRQLVIPEIRLGDWEAKTLETATGATPPP